MTDDFHKPVKRPSETFDRLFEAPDPAELSRAAHSTAAVLLSRVREEQDPEAVDRLIAFTKLHGIDDIAELWSRSSATSLPGSLWRLYLLQVSIHDDPATAALLYDRGRVELESSDAAVAGAPTPAGPTELVALIDAILRGAFQGDFAVALDRAAAFCRVEASGATHLADDYEPTEPERASELTRRALRLSTYARDLTVCARLWRRDSLT
ncbi:DNA-directed RNA polymerase subunit beta [Microbacterium stercoris]|uniref:DNA-directed RNA polymerase subunit beta n=1 Tax=Microbacterium stercoris TaxID=2820289 RepID=A0A939QSE8_9MICO|nr:DNA-directed RNA polymerase subunit beta [Microbacterium stercoris]MBO3663776.1 DNA-directed RNA polymerase subunit beta [Microbacterium stercoris]